MALETYRATVAPAHCDHLGHMNVQYYFAAVSDGMFAIMSALGLTRAEIARRHLSFAVIHAESDFKRELLAGDVIHLLSWVDSIGTKTVGFAHRLVRTNDSVTAFETLFKTAMLDLEARRGVAVPDDIRAAAEKLQAPPD